MSEIWFLAIVLLLVTVAMIFLLPRYLVSRKLTMDGIERRKLQNEVARTAIETLGGAFLFVAAIFTWQQVQNSSAQLKNSQDQLEVARQGQITERFTQAISQLASDQVSSRIGAIYALERIAGDSPRDHGAIIDVLSAFLRERARVRLDAPQISTREARSFFPAADIQAAATVIGRRNRANEPKRTETCNPLGGPNFPCSLNLEQVDFTGVDLSQANLDRANLRGARLAGANMAFSSFVGADLGFADLRVSNFRLSDLTETSLLMSLLEQTNLHLAKGLTCEQLRKAKPGPTGAANLTFQCPS
jgi:hypothetical protein